MEKEKFAQLEIVKKNVEFNYHYFRKKLKKSTKLLILVKANSYGHGAYEFAKLMEKLGADYFAVAHTIKGIELRKKGIKKTPIMVLSSGPDSYNEMIENGLEPAIPTLECIKQFRAAMKKMQVSQYPIHIKLDTGMHRLGFMQNEIGDLINYLKKRPEIRVQSIYSHLAASDEKRWDKFTLGQIELFDKMAKELDNTLGYHPLHHILNSAGIERFPEYQKDMVRLGIGIYGISAINPNNLKPAAELKCKIMQIKELKPSDGTVGYGRWGKIDKPMRIATIPLGYADGINRHLGRGRGKFCVDGKLVPTIGNICMDMCMLDVTNTKVKVGDVVTIFGENPTAQSIAKILETIPYEIFTSIDERIKRVVI